MKNIIAMLFTTLMFAIAAPAMAEKVIPFGSEGLIECRNNTGTLRWRTPTKPGACPISVIKTEVEAAATAFIKSGEAHGKTWVGLVCLPGKACPCGKRIPAGGKPEVRGELPVYFTRKVSGNGFWVEPDAWKKPKKWDHPQYGEGCWRH